MTRSARCDLLSRKFKDELESGDFGMAIEDDTLTAAATSEVRVYEDWGASATTTLIPDRSPPSSAPRSSRWCASGCC